MNEHFNNRQSEFLIHASESILRGNNRYSAVHSLATKASDIYSVKSRKRLGDLGSGTRSRPQSIAVKLAILALSKDNY